MQVQVEVSSGSSMPAGCYVGVRVGEVLKQGRYNPAQHYRFPKPERRRNAKIDVYRHVGSCCVTVDPEMKVSNEVKMSTLDPELSSLTLTVSSRPDGGKHAEQLAKDQRDARTKEVKQKAVDYMTKHAIEEKLSDAMKQVLKVQPADPIEFICRHLLGSRTDSLLATEGSTVVATQQALSSARPQPAASLHKDRERSFVTRPSVGTWLGFPSKIAASSPAAVSSTCSSATRRGQGLPAFASKPSVGTWLMPAPAPEWKAPLPEYVRDGWNLEGFRTAVAMDSGCERCEVERALCTAFMELTGEFEGGEYYPLRTSTSCAYRPGGMALHEEAALDAVGLRFRESDADGRGIFATPGYHAAAWVNCSASGCHVQFLARRPAGADGHREAYARLRRLESAMQETMRASGLYGLRPAAARTSMNLQTLRPPATGSRDELCEVERAVSAVLAELSGELAGAYFPLGAGAAGSLTKVDEVEQLVLAACDDPRALLDDKAGGRGVFITHGRDVTVLVNQGSHHVELVVRQRPQDHGPEGASIRLQRLEDALRLALRQDGYDLH